MKKTVVFSVVLIGAALTLPGFTGHAPADDADRGFAVVELFTSQGCSSCPAADRLLSEVLKEKGDKEIFGLSFHVSYWNYLGWKDPYSSEEYTMRQHDYGAAFRNSSIYTPQMVVNGKKEFVGSSQPNAKHAIAEALSEPASHQIMLQVQRHDNKLIIDYELEGETKGYVMNFALVERNIVTQVKRGENRNRTLRHDNVVRSFNTLPARRNSMAELSIPEGLKMNDGSIIAYVQHKSDLTIGGASGLKLTRVK